MNRKQRQRRREQQRRMEHKPNNNIYSGENGRAIIRSIFGANYYKRVIAV